jgi:plastocyanin
MKMARLLGVLLVVVALAAAACGGGDDEASTNEAATETTATDTTGTAETGDGAAGGTTTVGMDEFLFDPKDVTVDQGATITVENNGNVAHNLTVEQGPDPKEKSRKLAGTSSFLGGKSEDLEVDLEPGKYAMVCTVPGHREQGMTGTFTVR